MNTINLKDILQSIIDLPIIKSPALYFGLWGLVIAFAPNFGITFTTQQIAQVTGFIALVTGVAPPTAQYMQVKLYEARVRSAQSHVKDLDK